MADDVDASDLPASCRPENGLDARLRAAVEALAGVFEIDRRQRMWRRQHLDAPIGMTPSQIDLHRPPASEIDSLLRLRNQCRTLPGGIRVEGGQRQGKRTAQTFGDAVRGGALGDAERKQLRRRLLRRPQLRQLQLDGLPQFLIDLRLQALGQVVRRLGTEHHRPHARRLAVAEPHVYGAKLPGRQGRRTGFQDMANANLRDALKCDRLQRDEQRHAERNQYQQ